MARPGIRELRCEVCGQTREVEAGIKKMYCCAQKMVFVEEEEKEAPEPPLRLSPRR